MLLESLDAKCSIHILPSHYSNLSHNVREARCLPYAGGTLWEIDNFLTQYEVNTILENCEDHYDFLQYRNSHRCIAIDSNMILSNLISDRLRQNDFLNKLNGVDWQAPRGFSEGINWLPNDGTVNSCIRINKYVNGKFDYHRDAPLTCNSQLKSNYTLIIYLNDEYDGGYTEFLLPSVQYEYNGLSIKEELDLIGDSYNVIKIRPTIGKAIIFDHGVIHKSNIVSGTKYVLRTDLLCKGMKFEHESSHLYKSLEDLTCKLFRQAQLNELANVRDNDLYERCLSLRMNPNNITIFPEDLLKYIEQHPINRHILSSLKLLSRDSSVYTFEYNTLTNNKFDIVKIAILFALNTLTIDITDQIVSAFNENMFGNPIVHINDKYQKQSMMVTKRVQKLLDMKQEILGRSMESMSKKSSNKLIRINKELQSQTITIVNNKRYFSDSMGKYNMLEDIPNDFIKGLSNVIRIRSKGAGRSAFDLITSILINDCNLKRMEKSKVVFRVNADLFSDLPLNFFEKDFDSSLYETLKRLFVDFDLKYDSKHIRQLEFDEIGKISENFPVYTLVQLIGKQYAINIRKTMYSHYNRSRYDKQNINDPNAFCFHSFKFATTVRETQLNFHNVVFEKDNVIKGNVTIDSPTRYFNHAACQSDVVDEYVRNIKEVDGKIMTKYIMLEHHASFVMSGDKLVVTIVPNVVL